MSIFADFQPHIKGKPLDGVTYRLASEGDAADIAGITFQREGVKKKKTLIIILKELQKS